jgi:dTDP-L-rhamnose 4-epimerase
MLLLVTGGAGFIGRAVVTAALQAGHTVRVLDVAAGDCSLPPLPDGAEPVTGDVRDRDVVDRALRGVDAVSHQAAMVGLGVDLDDLPRYASCNDVGTAVLLAAMAGAGVGRLVLAGSMVVYGEGRYTCDRHGDVPAPPRAVDDLRAGRFEPRCPRCRTELTPALVGEGAVLDPRNGYAVTKLAQEQLGRVWARETGGAFVALRYHNVYGPGLPRNTPYAGVAAIFGSALARGQAPAVFEDGGQRRDFVHVRDVAAANLAAVRWTGDADQGGRPRTYNVASGTPRTVLDLAAALASAVNGPAPQVTGEFRLGDVRHVTADTARIRAELGWRPQVGFTAGIAELAAELVTAVEPGGGAGALSGVGEVSEPAAVAAV